MIIIILSLGSNSSQIRIGNMKNNIIIIDLDGVNSYLINTDQCIDSNQLKLETAHSARTFEIIFAQDGAHTPQKFQEPVNAKNWRIDWNANIEILKNGKLWQSVSISSPVAKIIITDDEEITGLWTDGFTRRRI